MFILTKVADLVQISPGEFNKRSEVAIEDHINAKYSNRVIQKIGLCVCLYDLLWSSAGLIGHRDGLINVNVEFRLLVFRPFKGETLLGKISSASKDGVRIRTDFFEDIFVPHQALPDGCLFDPQTQSWRWQVDEETQLHYDNNEMVRLQVTDEVWHDQAPDSASDEAVEKAKKTIPYALRASMAKEGLGVCLWWDGGNEEEEEGQGEGES